LSFEATNGKVNSEGKCHGNVLGDEVIEGGNARDLEESSEEGVNEHLADRH